jgi:hypothetical protein
MGTMEPLDQDSGIHPESKTMLNKETRIGNNLLASRVISEDEVIHAVKCRT